MTTTNKHYFSLLSPCYPKPLAMPHPGPYGRRFAERIYRSKSPPQNLPDQNLPVPIISPRQYSNGFHESYVSISPEYVLGWKSQPPLYCQFICGKSWISLFILFKLINWRTMVTLGCFGPHVFLNFFDSLPNSDSKSPYELGSEMTPT